MAVGHPLFLTLTVNIPLGGEGIPSPLAGIMSFAITNHNDNIFLLFNHNKFKKYRDSKITDWIWDKLLK
jgi:hypothetical protein